MTARDPQPPKELNAGTDLSLKKNTPFRIFDRWSTGEGVFYLVVGVVSFVVLAYFFWPKR